MFGIAVATVVVSIALKLISAEEASVILLPLAFVACYFHLSYHWKASKVANPPVLLMIVSDVLLLVAVINQIDFQWADGCGWNTLWGVGVRFSTGLVDRGCWRPVGAGGILLDVLYYVPAAVTWMLLGKRAHKS